MFSLDLSTIGVVGNLDSSVDFYEESWGAISNLV